MTVDTATGRVTNVEMEQSTSSAVLDNAVTSTFRRWRFRAGTATRVRQPIAFTMTGARYLTISPHGCGRRSDPQQSNDRGVSSMPISSNRLIAAGEPRVLQRMRLPGEPLVDLFPQPDVPKSTWRKHASRGLNPPIGFYEKPSISCAARAMSNLLCVERPQGRTAPCAACHSLERLH